MSDHNAEPENLSSLRVDLVDDSRYALDVLEDVRTVLFELAAEMEEAEHVRGIYTEELRVSQHALQTVKERLEATHKSAQELHEATE